MTGQSVGSDASRLSCFLFRPRKSRERRRKCSHTNVSNASVIRTSRVSQTPLQAPIPYFHQWVPHGKKALVAIACKTAHVCFRWQKWVHTRLSEKDRTQGLTRRNRGCFGWGWYHYPRYELHVHEHPRAGYQDGKLCRFWGLDLVYSRRTQRACGTAMRSCASLFRGVAAPPGCVIFFAFVEIAACTPCAQSFSRVQGGERYHYPRRALHVLETLDDRLSKRLVCRFLRSMGIAPRATPIFLRIYRYPCR